MFIVTFIVALLFFLVAAITFGKGLVNMYGGKQNATDIMTTGFTIGVGGVVVTAIIFVIFSI